MAGARKAREARGRLAEEPDRALVSVLGLLELAHAHVDGGEHVPAAAVVGALAQVRLDLGDEIGGARLLDRLADAGGIGPARQRRRPDHEIERDCGDGNCGRGIDRRLMQARGFARRRGCIEPRVLFRRADEPTRHLDARGLGFRARDQSVCALGLDLGELVAIDGKLAVGRGCLGVRVRKQRPRHRPRDGGCQNRKPDPH